MSTTQSKIEEYKAILSISNEQDQPPKNDIDFITWCQQQGIIMPKLEYPAVFDGVQGVKVNQDIAHNEAFLFVPYHLIISVNKTKSHKVLGKIIMEHPECFSDEYKEEPSHTWEHMILVLALTYEFSLGTSSKWYPYLQTLPFESEMSCDWTIADMELVQDVSLISLLKDTKATMIEEWLLFENVLKSHPEVFPKKLIDKKRFMTIYSQVQTRCFEVESLSLIPMADALNHNSIDISNDVINTELHIKGTLKQNYYRKHNQMFDISQALIDQISILPQFDRDQFASLKSSLNITNLMIILQSGTENMSIWDLPVIKRSNDADESDASSEEEEEEEKENKFQKATDFFAQKNQNKREIEPNKFESQIQNNLLLCGIQNEKLVKLLAKKSVQNGEICMDIDEKILNALEYVPIDQKAVANLSQKLIRKEQSIIEAESLSSDSEEDQYDWLDEENEKSTYFTLINESRETMKKGTQAWNCYGNFTNLFLLSVYGFCFENNKFNSYKLYLSLDLPQTDPKQKKKEPIQIKDMLACQGLKPNQICEFRLKLDTFSEELMAYLRYALKNDFFKIQIKNMNFNKVLDLKFEQLCIGFYLRLIHCLSKVTESQTSQEQDQELLKSNTLTVKQRSAVIFRSERKALLRSHVDIAKYLYNIIEDLTNGRNLDISDFNKSVIDTKINEFDSDLNSEKFMHPRISMRNYLKDLYFKAVSLKKAKK